MFSQLRLHPVHGDAAQQGVLLRGQPDEGPDRADAAQLRDAAGAHLHAAARPLHPAAEGVAGQLAVSLLPGEQDPNKQTQHLLFRLEM